MATDLFYERTVLKQIIQILTQNEKYTQLIEQATIPDVILLWHHIIYDSLKIDTSRIPKSTNLQLWFLKRYMLYMIYHTKAQDNWYANPMKTEIKQVRDCETRRGNTGEVTICNVIVNSWPKTTTWRDNYQQFDTVYFTLPIMTTLVWKRDDECLHYEEIHKLQLQEQLPPFYPLLYMTCKPGKYYVMENMIDHTYRKSFHLYRSGDNKYRYDISNSEEMLDLLVFMNQWLYALKCLNEHGWTHGDPHPGNFDYRTIEKPTKLQCVNGKFWYRGFLIGIYDLSLTTVKDWNDMLGLVSSDYVPLYSMYESYIYNLLHHKSYFAQLDATHQKLVNEKLATHNPIPIKPSKMNVNEAYQCTMMILSKLSAS